MVKEGGLITRDGVWRVEDGRWMIEVGGLRSKDGGFKMDKLMIYGGGMRMYFKPTS